MSVKESDFTEILQFYASTEFFEWNDDEQLNFDAADFESQEKFSINSFFAPIPRWQRICIPLAIILVGFPLNSVILKVYWKLKSGNRVYVIAMAVLDMLGLCVSLLLRMLFVFFEGQQNVLYAMQSVQFVFTSLNINLYMCVPLFLALDRFYAVAFPHKLESARKKLRRWKIVIVVTTSLVTGFFILADFVLKDHGKAAITAASLFLTSLALRVIAALVLYIVIAVKVYTSNKKMQGNRTGG